MSEPDLTTKLALTVVPFAVAYVFWLAYTNPTKNRLTRFINGYVEATKSPALGTSVAILAIAVIALAVGTATLMALLLGA